MGLRSGADATRRFRSRQRLHLHDRNGGSAGRARILRPGRRGWQTVVSACAAAAAELRKILYAYDVGANLRSLSDDTIQSFAPSDPDPELFDDRLYSFSYDALGRIDQVVPHSVPNAPAILLDSDYDSARNRDELSYQTNGAAFAHAWT